MKELIKKLRELTKSDNIEVKNTALLGLNIINQMSNDNLNEYIKLIDELEDELRNFLSGDSKNFIKAEKIFNNAEIMYEILKEEKPYLSDIKQFPEFARSIYLLIISLNKKSGISTLPYEKKLEFYQSINN